MQRRAFLATSAACCLPVWTARAADNFPVRPVRIVVPYAAGGGPDVQARQLGPLLGEALGQPIVVENKVGAAGVLAAQVVAAAAPDGYTVLQGAITHLLQKVLQPSLKFDPLADFSPIGNISTGASVLVVAADAPWRTAQELIAAARAAPGKMNFGSGGIGTTAHLAGATLVALAKLDAVHVPLRGSVEIAGSLLRGDTQFAFPIAATALPQIQGGKLRALAITSAERASALPDVPTLHELLGSKLAVQEAWSGLWAPARTPPEVVQRLFAALGSTLKTPAARKIIEAGGGQLAASASPQAYAEFIRAEGAKWTEIVRLIGLTPN